MGGCRTSQVPAGDFASPFVPFTGYTDNIKNDGAFMPASQSNEFGNAGSQKHVRSVSTETVEKIEFQLIRRVILLKKKYLLLKI